MSVKGVPEECSKIDCFRLGFQEGAKWADRTMLDKACEWLISSFDQLHNEYGRKLEFGNQDVFIEALKKAMEE